MSTLALRAPEQRRRQGPWHWYHHDAVKPGRVPRGIHWTEPGPAAPPPTYERIDWDTIAGNTRRHH